MKYFFTATSTLCPLEIKDSIQLVYIEVSATPYAIYTIEGLQGVGAVTHTVANTFSFLFILFSFFALLCFLSDHNLYKQCDIFF